MLQTTSGILEEKCFGRLLGPDALLHQATGSFLLQHISPPSPSRLDMSDHTQLLNKVKKKKRWQVVVALASAMVTGSWSEDLKGQGVPWPS